MCGNCGSITYYHPYDFLIHFICVTISMYLNSFSFWILFSRYFDWSFRWTFQNEILHSFECWTKNFNWINCMRMVRESSLGLCVVCFVIFRSGSNISLIFNLILLPAIILPSHYMLWYSFTIHNRIHAIYTFALKRIVWCRSGKFFDAHAISLISLCNCNDGHCIICLCSFNFDWMR